MTIPVPSGPGLPWVEPSVNITIGWSLTGSMIFLMYVFSTSSDINLSYSVNAILMQSISKERGVSGGILMR